MNGIRKAVLAATVVGSMLVGGVGGAMLYSTIIAASAASPSPTPSGGASATAPGKFVSNEDPAHEAGESATREAQENAGQVPTVP